MRPLLPIVLLALVMIRCAGTRSDADIQEMLDYTAAYYAEKGAAALQAGQFEAAVGYFRRAAQTLPQNPQAANNLGVAFYRAGHLDSAVAAHQKALRLRPSFVKAYVDMGYAYLEQKNFQDARRSAQEALAREANNASALLLLGRIAEAQGDLNGAEQFYQESIRHAPTDFSGYFYLAALNNERGDLDAALDGYQQAAARKPSDPAVYFSIGNIYARQCRLDDALASYEKSLRLDPHMTGALNNHGLILMSRGDIEGALADFNRALEIDSTASPVLFNLSVALGRLDSPAAALTFVNRAIRRDSSYALFHLQKGNILMELGQIEAAKNSFAKAAELEPSNAMIYNNLGNALHDSDPEQAGRAYQTALELYADYVDARYGSGEERLEQGIGDLLSACFDASRRAADLAMMYANLGRAKMVLGDLEQARRAFERAVAVQPLLIMPYEQLALIHQQKRDRPRQNRMLAHARLNQARALAAVDSIAPALEICRQALRFDPFFSEIYAEMGRLYTRLGDDQSASASFQKALKFKDDNPAVHRLYALYLAERRKSDAPAQFEKAVKLNPRDAELRTVFAALLDALGQRERAAEQRAWHHLLIGRQIEAAGRWEAALEEYRTAAALSPNAEFIAAQGLVYAKKKLNVEAELLLKRALELDPQNVTALYGLGITAQSRPEEALSYLRRAVAVDAEHAPSHRALAMIYHRLGDQDRKMHHLQKARAAGLEFKDF